MAADKTEHLTTNLGESVELSTIDAIEDPKKRAFLLAYVEVGTVTGAAKASGCSPGIHYFWRDHDLAYAAAFKLAKELFSESLLAEVYRRAVTAKKRSDILLMFLTKGFRPEFRDNFKPEINVNIANINATKEQFDFEKFRTLLR